MKTEHISGYFDYNATTPISDEVAKSMISAIGQFANPSSSNNYSQLAKTVVSHARENVAKLLNVKAPNIFFTSGGTEANNWAIKGVLSKHSDQPGHIITSAIEHASVHDPIKYCIQQLGYEVTYLKPDSSGAINVADLKGAIRANTQLISVMYANNETGVIQPISAIAKIAHEHSIPMHVDAVQLVGKQHLDVTALNVDYLSLSAHKFYGPKGIGCLYIKDISSIDPLIHGGGQESAMRSGTENVMAIAGLSKAAEEAQQAIEQWNKEYWSYKQHMIALLNAAPIKVKFNGATNYIDALPNTLNITIEGIRAEALAARMEMLHHTIISIGSACSNNKTKKASHVLTAMGLNEVDIQASIRVSFGRFTSLSAIEMFVQALVAETQVLLSISESGICKSN
ncbi:cysteine desulfurase family protein [Pseudoalteromonas ostreae]|uniref:cysteine desulfurase family protein n=1 Tax=Pseudoalteromonas ostreae TaxID=2774154 RepID=UPI001B365414|nr:cysteine desulfurase family protein [Pseudoalteromonas ostreae]